MNNKKSVGHAALLFVNILWGINLPVSKALLTGAISPVGLNALRFIAGAIAFWLFALIKWEPVSKKDLFLLIIGSLFGLLGNQICFIQGLSRTSTIDASIIATTVPILTMILSALILKEPLTWLKALGVFVGASGAVFLVMSAQNGPAKSGSLSGDLLCFSSALSYSLFLVITKPVTQRYSSITIMKWMFLVATVCMVPFSLKELSAIHLTAMNTQQLLSLSFTLILATIVPYLLIPISQKLLRPTTQSMYNYVQPVVAMAITIMAGTNTLTVTKSIAACMIFLGVYIVTRSKSRADIEATKLKLATETEKVV